MKHVVIALGLIFFINYIHLVAALTKQSSFSCFRLEVVRSQIQTFKPPLIVQITS